MKAAPARHARERLITSRKFIVRNKLSVASAISNISAVHPRAHAASDKYTMLTRCGSWCSTTNASMSLLEHEVPKIMSVPPAPYLLILDAKADGPENIHQIDVPIRVKHVRYPESAHTRSRHTDWVKRGPVPDEDTASGSRRPGNGGRRTSSRTTYRRLRSHAGRHTRSAVHVS